MLKLSRPLHLLLATLTYTLGVSISVYLGNSLQIPVFILGLSIVLFGLASMNLFAEVFRPHNEPLIKGETPKQKETLRNNLLYVSITFLGASVTFSYLLLTNYTLSITTFYFLLFTLLLIILYAIPPFRLINRGFGEFTLAVQISYLIPSIGFLLQANEPNRLLTVLIIPLTSLALAYFLVLNFPTFADDQKYERGTMLRLLTWQHAVPLHHSLIIFSFVVFALAPLFGFSFNLIWPAFLTFPFAIFQMIQLQSISNGNPPNWRLLTLTALAVFVLTTYFLTLTFWLR